MTDSQPLTLHGIADTLGVTFYRVRRWRENFLKERSQARRLPAPDVSTLARNPLWSKPLIIAFAKEQGLWPPASDQFLCSRCRKPYSIYDNGTVRPHGWEPGPDGLLYECEGSSQPHAGPVRLELAGAAS